jgi:hypothetical protein
VDIDGSSLGVPAAGFYAVPVTVGISDNFNVEILDGVEDGAEVFAQVMRQNGGLFY